MVLVLESLHLLLQFLHLRLSLIPFSIRFLFCVFHILASLMESEEGSLHLLALLTCQLLNVPFKGTSLLFFLFPLLLGDEDLLH
jgi:hypothetical protein